jgi:hypothetical protein
MLQAVRALVRGGFARDWTAALAMPWDMAMQLLDDSNGGEGGEVEKQRMHVEPMPDGGQKVSFTDVRDLAAVLPASYFGKRSKEQ